MNLVPKSNSVLMSTGAYDTYGQALVFQMLSNIADNGTAENKKINFSGIQYYIILILPATKI